MSSTIRQAIEALKGRIADAYTAISAKGGTLPAQQTAANLPDAIASIPEGGGGAKTKISISSVTNLYSYNTDVELHEEFLDLKGTTFGTWSSESMFRNCTNVKKIDLSTMNCTIGRYSRLMFYYCPALEELYMNGNFAIASSDAAVNCGLWFYGDTNLKTLRVGSWFTRVQDFDISPTAMDRDSIVQFLNDIGTAYDNTQTITMGSTKLALLSNEDIAIATSKGWTLA